MSVEKHHLAGHIPLEQLMALESWFVSLPCMSRATYPFSFTYDGASSDSFLPEWEFRATRSNSTLADRVIHVFTWTEPMGRVDGGRLNVTVTVTLYNQHPNTTDWVVWLDNIGSGPTGIVRRPDSVSIPLNISGDPSQEV